jgi:putative FmdB family regulatory protein
MPVYDCCCRDCGEINEVFVQKADSEPIRCRSCGSSDLERLLSTFSVLRAAPGNEGGTCCGREERCDSPPCSSDGTCSRI